MRSSASSRPTTASADQSWTSTSPFWWMTRWSLWGNQVTVEEECTWFGSRSARIFRLLLRKHHLEQKQVEDFAMIPAKEAKDMLYTLLKSLRLLTTPLHVPSTCTLSTSCLLPAYCYNTATRRLLEKSQRIVAILASLQASGAEPEQLTEVEEMITAPERQQLEALRHHINKLDSTENQVDETVFLLESYIFSTKTK
ncbi:DNA-directed RNA polymerase III subunit RPC3-like [Oncorhynchus clarkii lewisi]|uniref:DNA-directed RNA polymerase III subunit RPC3-like n=1 Tax=Oncorhynchus clarkii lewisi TaxID=490388 RepID=UPI0039B85163